MKKEATNKLNHYLNRPLGQAYSQQQPNYQFELVIFVNF